MTPRLRASAARSLPNSGARPGQPQKFWKNVAIAPAAKLGMAWGSPGRTHQTTGYPGMQPWYSTHGDGSTGFVVVLQPLYCTSLSIIGCARVMGRAVSASPCVAQIATGRAGLALVHLAPLIGAPDIAPIARKTSLMLHAAVKDIEPPKLN